MKQVVAILLFVTVVAALPAGVHADDDKEMSLRIYDVGALTHGRVQFHSQFPPTQDPRRPGDALLLVSSNEVEYSFPVGQIDELIELIKGSVDPAFWESVEGADISALPRGLVVRATDGVHAQVGRTLAAFERRLFRMVTVELQAVQLTPAQRRTLAGDSNTSRLDADKVDALLAAGVGGPALRLLVEHGSSAEGFGGAQRTFVRTHDVDVAQSSQTSVPIIGVANPGLAAVVRPTLGPARSSRLRVSVRASLSHGSGFRTKASVTGDSVELPNHALLDIYEDILLEPGQWGLLGGVTAAGSNAQWMLLARATPVEPAVPATASALKTDVTGEAATLETMEVRFFNVRSLSKPIFAAPGTGAFLRDTASAPLEPEEVGEPTPPLPTEWLVELVRESTGNSSLWEDPATIEGRNGMLIVRHAPKTLAGIEGLLQRVAREMPAVLEATVSAIAVDDSVARALTAATAGTGAVLPETARTLLDKALADGTARSIGQAQVASMDGARNTICSGKHTTYLQTYAASIAESAVRARPVTAQYLAGFEVEIEAHRLAGDAAALLQLRLMHTTEEGPMRSQSTAHGPIELPALATARVRTTATVPFGQTAWVASTKGEGSTVLFLATVRRQRR